MEETLECKNREYMIFFFGLLTEINVLAGLSSTFYFKCRNLCSVHILAIISPCEKYLKLPSISKAGCRSGFV